MIIVVCLFILLSLFIQYNFYIYFLFVVYLLDCLSFVYLFTFRYLIVVVFILFPLCVCVLYLYSCIYIYTFVTVHILILELSVYVVVYPLRIFLVVHSFCLRLLVSFSFIVNSLCSSLSCAFSLMYLLLCIFDCIFRYSYTNLGCLSMAVSKSITSLIVFAPSYWYLSYPGISLSISKCFALPCFLCRIICLTTYLPSSSISGADVEVSVCDYSSISPSDDDSDVAICKFFIFGPLIVLLASLVLSSA